MIAASYSLFFQGITAGKKFFDFPAKIGAGTHLRIRLSFNPTISHREKMGAFYPFSL